MRTDLFDFELPAEHIALRPAQPRESARMLVVQGDGVLRDRTIAELPHWLRAGRPARRQRHQGDRGPTQGAPHRPRDRAEDRGDADQAARRLALAGAGQAGQEACARATSSASATRARSACSAISTPRSRPRAATARSRCRSRSTARRSTRPLPISAPRRCRPTSPPSVRPTIRMRPTTRPCSRPMRARSQRPPRGCISRRRWRPHCAAMASDSIA